LNQIKAFVRTSNGSPELARCKSKKGAHRGTSGTGLGCHINKARARTNPASSRCVIMRHREQKSVGPMSNQRAQDFAISPALPRMPTASEPAEVPASLKRATREDAIRLAKAKISRRRSLRMQREAQKGQSA
jgi:hypothetical protein